MGLLFYNMGRTQGYKDDVITYGTFESVKVTADDGNVEEEGDAEEREFDEGCWVVYGEF